MYHRCAAATLIFCAMTSRLLPDRRLLRSKSHCAATVRKSPPRCPPASALPALVIYSEEYPRRSLQTLIYNANASVPNLAPGNYQVFAFTATSELEYRNPAAIEKYLKHAIPVTLQP